MTEQMQLSNGSTIEVERTPQAQAWSSSGRWHTRVASRATGAVVSTEVTCAELTCADLSADRQDKESRSPGGSPTRHNTYYRDTTGGEVTASPTMDPNYVATRRAQWDTVRARSRVLREI